MTGIVLTAALLVGAAQPQPVDADRRCLECHGQPHIGQLPPGERAAMVAPGGPAPPERADPRRPGLYVRPEALTGSVHAGLRCTDCHAGIGGLPHASVLAPVACASCHTEAGAEFDRSSHGAALARGAPDAPTCVTCHGTHDIGPSSRRTSLTHPFEAVRICGDCHRQHAGPSPGGWDPGERVEDYLEGVHGRGVSEGGLLYAATCADCHGAHAVLPAGDPQASTNRVNIPATCGKCHLGVVETYAASIHGTRLAEGRPNAPVCTDCHTGHRITRAGTPQGLQHIVAECGQCHDRPDLAGGRRAGFYKTYRASYHGQVSALGSTVAARCSDCHGAHDILPIDDVHSRLHGANRIETCRRCHAGAPDRFASFDPHADYLDRARYPLLNAVWWYFVIVMSAAFGFFIMHSLLWFVRSLIEARHRPSAPRPTAGSYAIRRFTVLNRFNHALLIGSFFGLTLTGLPLLLSEQRWARTLSAWLGGGDAVGVLHRVFAVLLIANFVIHVAGLAHKARTHKGSLRRDWLTGPNSMLPRRRDFGDCAAMFRWFFRGGTKPTFDRWTYWEKFDYLAEIFGTLIIGISGLLLWFPVFFSWFLPGWTFNVATIVHGYEALLAVGFIFTVHFFNAHLRAEKFPVDDVIFTGQVPEDEYRHERGAEYARLQESGRLASLREPAAPAWQRKAAIVIGAIAMAIGFTLVGLIIAAGFEALS